MVTGVSKSVYVSLAIALNAIPIPVKPGRDTAGPRMNSRKTGFSKVQMESEFVVLY